MGTGGSFPVAKQSDGKANDFLPSGAIMSMWSYTCATVYMAWHLITKRHCLYSEEVADIVKVTLKRTFL
jgi:hypothetical protein